MKIALIAHDHKRTLTIRLTTTHKHTLERHELYTTRTTGMKVMEAAGLPVHCFKSGPPSGDQQIGAVMSEDNTGLVIFLRDPFPAQPHESGVTASICLSDVYEIPLTTNIGSAEIPLRGVEAGFADFREVTREGDR